MKRIVSMVIALTLLAASASFADSTSAAGGEKLTQDIKDAKVYEKELKEYEKDQNNLKDIKKSSKEKRSKLKEMYKKDSDFVVTEQPGGFLVTTSKSGNEKNGKEIINKMRKYESQGVHTVNIEDYDKENYDGGHIFTLFDDDITYAAYTVLNDEVTDWDGGSSTGAVDTFRPDKIVLKETSTIKYVGVGVWFSGNGSPIAFSSGTASSTLTHDIEDTWAIASYCDGVTGKAWNITKVSKSTKGMFYFGSAIIDVDATKNTVTF